VPVNRPTRLRPLQPAPALVLFDIDGTLVRRAGPHHRQALVESIRRVTGLETTTDGIPLHGMLDPDIIAAMMQREGAPAALIRRSMPRILSRAESIYVRTVPVLARKTCPGVRGVLRRLDRQGVVLGLVTGNLTRIGWKKLERAGLRDFFRFGVFGEMSRDRTGLVRLALERARRERWIEPDTPASLVGDAPADIRAAKANHIRSIAVSTGVTLPEELLSHGPDVLLEDLRALKIEILLKCYNSGPGTPRCAQL
jgi:phosphoglycolate phosphatase-like HAD superfamily hydrolase